MYWFFLRSRFITEFQMENGLLDVNLKLFTILNMILHIILWGPNHTSFDFNETTLIDFPESWLGLGLSYCCVIESIISILIQFSISFKSYMLAVLCTWSCAQSDGLLGWKSPSDHGAQPSPSTMSKCHLQGWGPSHCPGNPVPMFNNPFNEGIYPNSQSKPSLIQCEAIYSFPITC